MNKAKKTLVSIIGFLITILVIITFYMIFNTESRLSVSCIDLDDCWKVEINGNVYENVKMSELVLGQMMKGDTLAYSCILPETDIQNPLLALYTIHSEIEVFIDDELVYSYGKEAYEADQLIGYGYHLIPLPQEYAGKTLIVRNYVGVDRAFTTIKTPRIANGVNFIRDFIIDNRIPLVINIALFVFGIALTFISVIYMIYNKEFFKLLCAAAFSIGVAAWSICNYDLVILFTYEPLVKTYVEFTALYSCPIPFMLYFWKDYKLSDSRLITIIYRILLFAQILFTCSSLLLQKFNIVKLPEVLVLQHILLFGMIMLMAVACVRQILQHRFHYKALMIGLAVMLFSGLIDIINFNVGKYLTNTDNYFNSALCVGTFLFVIGQILDFCNEIRSTLYESAKTETLEKMAYTDSLTGIANRRYCEETFDRLEKSDSDYGLIVFDLNNLKETNDIKGHESGDILIREFSEILQRVFGMSSVVGRMGGDEFIVILPDMKKINLQQLLENMEKQIQISNEIQQDINISVAYGFCQKREDGAMSVKSVYRRADAKMYDMKLSMKYKQSSNKN